MNTRALTKENILTRVGEYELLNYYLRPYHSYGTLRAGKHISNPFLSERQKTPSFNIYKVCNSDHWRYKDFATDDEGDVFDLIKRLNVCDFKEALQIINNDFQLGLGIQNDLPPQINPLVVERVQWTNSELDYWRQYGITEEILDRHNVKSLSRFEINKDGNKYTFTASSSDPIFAYEVLKNKCYKAYRPFTIKQQFKFLWLGNKPEEYYIGYDQLPEEGKEVYITGGEKDVLALAAKGYHAISCNSETAIPSAKIISDLEQRFDKIILLYDIDDTGLSWSEKICRRYGLSRIVLPIYRLIQTGGKDISDYFKLGYSLEHKACKFESFSKTEEVEAASMSNLEKLLATREIIQANKSKNISFASTILKQNQDPVFFPHTINVLQGKAGNHKSRLAETICSALLKRPSCTNHLIGFKSDMLKICTVCYVDTERNLSEQLPYSLQQIQTQAGYDIEDKPPNFDFVSLLDIPRQDRFQALTEFLEFLRTNYSGHIFIVLDVLTDLINDFNRPTESMKLIDLMNEVINKHNVTFLCLIHENPGASDKARGHLGTEIMNKASTVLQVGFEKGKNGELTDLVRVKYLKCRNTRRHEPFYIEYSSSERKLVLADEGRVAEVMESRKQKAACSDIADHLQILLTEPMSSRELIKVLCEEFNCSDKLIRDRLRDMIDTGYVVRNQEEVDCRLQKSKQGKEIFYSLKPIVATRNPI